MVKTVLHILTICLLFLITNRSTAQTYLIDTCSFNSADMDFAPTYYKNGIIYCSNRKSRIFSNYFDQSNVRVTDIYFWNDSLGTSVFQNKINTKVHEGPVSFTGSYDTMFTTQNQFASLKGFTDEKNTLGLYIKVKENNKWSAPIKLPFVEKDFSYAHPSFDNKNQRLYFSSNMSGGFGGMDLYYCDLANGIWSAPVNLGKSINTQGNELFPFIDVHSNLYLSTNYYSDSADLDIYYTSQIDSVWNIPSKLSAPINSSYDDFTYISDSTGDKGYFSSNRNGSDDIYKFTYVYPAFEECEENHKPSLCWEFAEEERVDLDSIPVVYQWGISTGDTLIGLSIDYCFPDTGYYEISLSLRDTITGLAYMNVGEYALSIEAFNRPYIESKDTVLINNAIYLNADVSRLVNYDVLEYFWQLSDGTMRKGSGLSITPSEEGYIYPTLGVIAVNKATKQKEKLCAYKVIAVVETPFIDTTEANDIYDQNKLDILEQIEIPSDSMIYSVQLFESDSLYTSSDSLFKDFVNRVYPRYLDQEGSYSYEIMYSDDISTLYGDFAKAVEMGFDETILRQIAKNALSVDTAFFSRLNNESLVNLIKSGVIEALDKIELTVYFDVNSAHVESAFKDSIQMACAKAGTNVIVLLEGFTDANGSYEYNLELSKKRVDSVKKHLFNYGLHNENMTSIWFGEKFALEGDGKGLNAGDRKVTIVLINK